MFDSEDMDDFMDPTILDNIEKKDKVTKAYYLYVYKLLVCVNEIWRKKLAKTKLLSKPNIFDIITPSDEAFVRWVIKCKIDSIHALKGNNYEIDKSLKGKKKGPHDSSKDIDEYIRIHNEIILVRDNETQRIAWNDLFWTVMEEKHMSQILLSSAVKNQRTHEEVNETRAKLPKLDTSMELYQL